MTSHNVSLFQRSRGFACLLAVALACTASFAEKPDWAGGGGKGDKQGKHEKKQGNKHDDRQDNPEQMKPITNRNRDRGLAHHCHKSWPFHPSDTKTMA